MCPTARQTMTGEYTWVFYHRILRSSVQQSVQSLGYGVHDPELDSPQVQNTFLPFKTSRPALTPTRPPIQLVLRLFSGSVTVTTHLHSAEVKNE